MINISLNKEPIKVNLNTKYILIDALYINDIRENISKLKNDNLINDIRENIFPYTDTPLAEYTSNDYEITLNQIKAVNAEAKGSNIFSVDSGVLIVINKKYFLNFATKFFYDKLTDSDIDILNMDYWENITKDYLFTDIGIIVAPDITSGVDFQGSGIYKII